MQNTDNPGDNRDFGVDLLDRLTDKLCGSEGNTSVDPVKLRLCFLKSLSDLQNARVKLVSEASRLEKQCRVDNARFVVEINKLSDQLSEACKTFKDLDTKINVVSGKIIHLGDHLERRNTPRESLKEARRLILEFSKFLGAGGGTFANIPANLQADESLLIEKCANIRALSVLCLELPNDERFLVAKQRVTVASQNLENLLVKRFRHNFSGENDEMMRRIAEVLSFSKSQSGCAEVFIDDFLKCLPSDLGDLTVLPEIMGQTESKIIRIFRRPENVIFHLVQALFSRNLKTHFQSKVRLDMPTDVFLSNLYTEYSNLDRLVFALIDRLHLLSDEGQLFKLLGGLADEMLRDYPQREIRWLSEHLSSHLVSYYISNNHQKRPLNHSGFSELRNRLHINSIDSTPSDGNSSGAVLLLSQEVAINMVDDVRQSAKRCMLLSRPAERSQMGVRIFDMLIRYLLNDHIDYGISLALQNLNGSDPKSSDPSFTFFAAVNEGTTLFGFFEKAMNECITPLLAGNPERMQACQTRRAELRRRLEEKLSSGLAQCLNLTIARIQAILSSEQRKSDFRAIDVSLSSNAGGTTAAIGVGSDMAACSPACRNVCRFLRRAFDAAKQNLDGLNVRQFLAEFGGRFHRVLVEHFYGFVFSGSGGFAAMQDVSAYREMARECCSPPVDCLFDVLFRLMNLTLIAPQNVRQVWTDYEAAGIPRDLLANFIALRADYKPKLAAEVKRYLESEATR